MGLDMFAYCTKEDFDKPVDFVIDDDNIEEFYYWRKHPNLHGYMKSLYYKKGGEDQEFNTVNLELTLEDLDELEEAVVSKELPYTTGFFFGESDNSEESVKQDLDFIQKARDKINQGYKVFYSSWW